MLSTLPPAKALLADKGYDADCFREVLADRNYEACISSKSNRKIQIPHDKALCRKRRKIENNFGKLKDWRRIHTRYDVSVQPDCAAKFEECGIMSAWDSGHYGVANGASDAEAVV